MSDKNFKSFADIPNLGDILIPFDLNPDESYDDTLKFSHTSNGVVVTNDIYGGKEDCIDVNRGCENITITTAFCYPRGKYLATIKGGSRNIKLQCMLRRGRHVVEYGNWSDNGNARSTGNSLQCISPDGAGCVVVVRRGYAEWPVLTGNVTFKKDYIGSALIMAYCFVKGLFFKSTPPTK